VKPSEEDQSQIDEIAKKPHHYNLSGDEEIFLWKFRYSFILKKEMLIKFLLATQWKSSIQAAEALQIMKRWNNVDHAEAIPLLSGLFCAND
jgi:phosphatidylinositol 3-kinase